jgi:uncharacterized NAD(P)/FAD-binding protein YdhS
VADDPGHFARWLAARDPAATGETFAQRRAYGRYLTETLAGAERDARGRGVEVRHVGDEAVDVLPDDGERCRVLTSRGLALPADTVVLAPGPGRPGPPPGLAEALRRHPAVVEDGSDCAALPGLRRARRVLVVGTGLTMIDVALALRPERGGPEVVAVSRSGLLPRAHRVDPPPCAPPPRWPRRPLTADALARGIDDAIRDAGGDWRAVIDAVRPDAQRLWRALPLDERRRFMSRYARRWDVHRHRMAPEVHARVRALLAQRRLRIVRGGVAAIEPAGSVLAATLRADGGELRLAADAVVGATGFGLDARRTREPLIAALVARGLAAPDPLGLGLRTAPDGALLDVAGRRSPVLRTLGAQRRGDLWETTAVPEIRAQAAAIAGQISLRSSRSRLSRSTLIS